MLNQTIKMGLSPERINMARAIYFNLQCDPGMSYCQSNPQYPCPPGHSRWDGINMGFSGSGCPEWGDCSSWATWIYWTAIGNGPDVVNNEGWRDGYTGTMIPSFIFFVP